MDELPIREKTALEDLTGAKRLASLDFQRGLAIWMMVFLHVFNHMIDYSAVDAGKLFSFETGYGFFSSLFFVFAAFFGNWIGYFIIISAIVNAYATTKKALTGTPLGRLFGKQILSGIGILLAGVITESFGYYGYFGVVLRSDQPFTATAWTNPDAISAIWERFFLMEALQIIGWCMIITAIIQYFLFLRGGADKYIRNIIVLGSITLVIFILSPIIWNLVDNMAYWQKDPLLPIDDYNNNWPSDHFQAFNHGIVSYLLTIIAGDYYPLFPFLGASLLGAVMGTAMSMPNPHRRLPLIGLGLFLALLAAGGICAALLPFDITFNRPYLGFFFFLIGGQVGVIVLLFYLIEWRGKGEKFAKNIIVKYFRTWGMLALTIFGLQIWSLAPRAVFNWTMQSTNVMNELIDPFTQKGWFGIVLLFAIATILFYDLIVWLWAQVNFTGSYEWFIIKFNSLSSKQPSNRLNFKYMLNQVDWMNYKPLIKPKEVKLDEVVN
ncbi:MAG: hypothetical protein JXA54_10260 [Candidatus Heimdallarchaeota archaeon]|nr:hypothetical protein [Candidatus Heimdallarchaeota archaeon]